MTDNFNPIQGQRGEFRIALHLSELGDRAWEILKLADGLGFHQPQFQTHVRRSGSVEVWAVLLQQFHSYDADTTHIVDVWDDELDQLRQAIGLDHHLSLIVLCNFREYLEPLSVA